jgi:hypothetical protein
MLLSSAGTAFAHPMGNFSINHYAKIKVRERSVEIRYLIDMAEIPTFQETRQFNITPKADDPSVASYLGRQEQLLKAGLSLESDGKSVELDPHPRLSANPDSSSTIEFLPNPTATDGSSEP